MSFLLTQAASVFAGAFGDGLDAQNTAANAENRADVDRFNALVAEQEAKAEMDSARADASDFRRAQSARVAAARARRAGSGFALEGSPMLVDEAALTEIEFGVSRIMHRGVVRETRKKTEASLLRNSADVEERNAKSARRAGFVSAIARGVRGGAETFRSLANAGVQFG